MHCNVNSPVAPNDETYVVTKHPNINNIYTFKNVCIKNYLKGKKRSLANYMSSRRYEMNLYCEENV